MHPVRWAFALGFVLGIGASTAFWWQKAERDQEAAVSETKRESFDYMRSCEAKTAECEADKEVVRTAGIRAAEAAQRCAGDLAKASSGGAKAVSPFTGQPVNPGSP